MNRLYNNTAKTLRALLIFSASCFLLNFATAAEQKPQIIKTPASGVSKVQKPGTSLGGTKAEQRLPATLQHRERAVSKEDYKKLSNKSPGATVNTPSRAPIIITHKQQLKPDSKTISEHPKQSNLDYKPLKNASKIRIQKSTPQWNDQHNHDPGKTTINLRISNKQFDNSIKRNHPSLNQPDSVKPDSKDYKLSPEPGDIQFGDGRSGRIPSSTNNSAIPTYRTGNGSSIIDARHGFNSGIDSVPANNNTSMTKTHQNDSNNNYFQNSKTAGKQTHTGFKRKPVTDDPSEGKGSK